MADFSAELPLPVVRDAILELLEDAGVAVPTGKVTLNVFPPTSAHPEGGVQIRVSDVPDSPKAAE